MPAFRKQTKKWTKNINKSVTSAYNGRSDVQEVSQLLYNPWSYYRRQKNPLIVHILGQMNPVHIVSANLSYSSSVLFSFTY